jgi:hypothetical protein
MVFDWLLAGVEKYHDIVGKNESLMQIPHEG